MCFSFALLSSSERNWNLSVGPRLIRTSNKFKVKSLYNFGKTLAKIWVWFLAVLKSTCINHENTVLCPATLGFRHEHSSSYPACKVGGGVWHLIQRKMTTGLLYTCLTYKHSLFSKKSPYLASYHLRLWQKSWKQFSYYLLCLSVSQYRQDKNNFFRIPLHPVYFWDRYTERKWIQEMFVTL